MATKSELQRLRDEVKRQQANANRKVSRNRAKGVEIANTPFDIRRDIAKTKTYNMRQLNNYLYELVGFNSRSTNFVAGVEGKPIHKDTLDRYNAAQKAYNAVVKSYEDSVGGEHIKSANMTVAERNQAFRNNVKKAQGEAVNKPYQFVNREPHNINGEEAAKRLAVDLERRMKKSYLPGEVKRARGELKQMLDILGESDLNKEFRKLSNDQFMFMWVEDDTARNVSSWYEFQKKLTTGDAKEKYKSIMDGNRKEIVEILKDAKKRPRTFTKP